MVIVGQGHAHNEYNDDTWSLSLYEQVVELSNWLPDDFEEIDFPKVYDYSEDIDNTPIHGYAPWYVMTDDTKVERRGISRHNLWAMMSGNFTSPLVFLNLNTTRPLMTRIMCTVSALKHIQ